MSEQLYSGLRFCPSVDLPKKSPEERAAEAQLGFELAPGGLWTRPLEAAAYWAWLRDRQPDPCPTLDEVLAWLKTFLGLTDRPTEAPRYFALGFAQGAEMALQGLPLPDALLDPVPDTLVIRGAAVAASLDTVAGPAPLSRLRNWVGQWLTHESMEVPTSLWRLGLSMGHGAAQTHPLVCGMLAAELDAARFDQRFASQALLATRLRRDMNPWQAFIRSTYGRPVEGEVLSAAIGVSLGHMRSTQGTLRSFLLDAVIQGRSHGESSSPVVNALLTEIGQDQMGHLRSFYEANSGPTSDAASEGTLLETLRLWIFRTHPGLFGANDPGAENVALRHAYDFLWWRGFIETTPK